MEFLLKSLKENEQEHLLELNLSDNHPIINEINRWKILDSIKHFKLAKETQWVRTDELIKPIKRGDNKMINLIDYNNNNNNNNMKKEEDLNSIKRIGLNAISNEKVGAIIMSGGQGTRLGYNGPKGMYNIGLPSNKTIFQLHIEKIMSIRNLSNKKSNPSIPIYIMTSDLNDKIIKDYFHDNNYFGYPSEDIYFFEQGLMPCLTFDGKIIIESENKLALSPDGNGGIYNALLTSGALDDMINRGIEHLNIYGIDNILIKPLDPAFLGICISNNVQLGNKTVLRKLASEKVGVTANINDKMWILEYSDIPKELADAIDDEGDLLFQAANICNHYMSLSFIKDIVIPNLGNSYHLAPKKIPYWDPKLNQTIIPLTNNGINLEMLVFDVFPLADKWIVVEADRNEEFGPVKNEPGNPVDSPDTARALITAQAKGWLKSIGAKFISKSIANHLCEISPLLSYEGEGLEKFKNVEISLPCYLE